MNLAVWLERAAARRPRAPALHLGATCVADHAVWADRAARLAGALAARGVSPGDRVAIWAKNAPDYLVALLGIWWAGAAAVPVNARLHAAELNWILENSGAALLVTDRPEGRAGAVEIGALPMGEPLPLVSRGSDDLAWLFYTSGTTGRPKGVCITHGMLTAMALAYPVDVDPLSAEDAAVYAGPMSHGAGLYALPHLLAGARHVVPVGGFDPAELLRLTAEVGRASMFLAPTMVHRLLGAARAAGDRGDGIRTIVYGGGPMYLADLEAALDWFGPKFVQIYGQGECPMAITALSRDEIADRVAPGWAARAGSVGRAQSVVEVAVEAEPGAAGEILVRGLPVMPGYWRNPQASAETLRDGWLRTGDVGRLEGGYLTLVDRSKDLIISGGHNVYPREVEEALLTHPDVSEASVIGVPDAEWGERVMAVIVGTASEATLDAHCRARIAGFKLPRRYAFVEALPKNAYGKVLKTDLRARFGA
ncbi:AMP-binding protein [Jannaschia seohaensis]|uniref:3-methylmercaptopropionyl-CoA ligase n=1 Tax=Jannaschia seohaensis TaxID=475081 RepID=A0A2Y9C5V5_9RHOB|nr:AMP-binding protein [Jannaschia seohaensis]PWJ21357.1 long-chain acyl-CoA synthetase [Jannaschia seohaensis]SSA41963.1 long-chain acyl-CoA synthetase [Jannaschia seohaensis]